MKKIIRLIVLILFSENIFILSLFTTQDIGAVNKGNLPSRLILHSDLEEILVFIDGIIHISSNPNKVDSLYRFIKI